MDYLQYQEIEGEIVLYPPISLRAKLPNNYKYNGKELQDELGLNLYDYGARNYAPAIGRFMNIDPLASKYFAYSPYTYTINNPLRFVDPNGMEISEVTGGYKYTGQDAVDVFGLLQASARNNAAKNKGSIGIINFGDGKTDIAWGRAMKFAVPEAIISNVPASIGRGGYTDFYNSLKEISDKSPDGIGFLSVFSHGGYSKTNGEGMIFADANEHPDADNVYTSDLYQIGNSVNAGDLKFASNSVIYLGGCNVSTVYNGQSFAMELALWTGSTVYGAADGHMNAVNPNNGRNTKFYPDAGGTIMVNSWPYGASQGTATPASSQIIDVVKMVEDFKK